MNEVNQKSNKKLLWHARVQTFMIMIFCIAFIIVGVFAIDTMKNICVTSNTINTKVSEMDSETLNRALKKYAESDGTIWKLLKFFMDKYDEEKED